MDERTLGQCAYEAYAAVLHDTVLLEPWRRLLWLDRCAWEAAAQAVRDHATVRAVAEAAVQAALDAAKAQKDTP